MSDEAVITLLSKSNVEIQDLRMLAKKAKDYVRSNPKRET